MNATACPDEDTLAAIAAGDSVAPDASAHAAECPSCRERLRAFEVGLNTLQNIWAAQKTVISSPAAASRPMEVGKYLIVGTLGEGSQAVVYRGLHQALGREVVLKVGKHAAPPDEQARAGLANEGKVLSMLDHPGIARVFDLDWHDGRPCLVMDHVAGIDLEKFASSSKPSPEQAAALVASVARAADAAHARGVVHSDIKPRNILVRDEDGRPVLIDFGLAWLRKAGGDVQDPPGGTIAYMAPEQARGEADRVGPASDIFSLGAVLYFLLTGEPPFRGTEPGLVMRKAMVCEIDTAALERSGAPARLRRLCLWAMAPRAADRPGSAAAFADELEKASRPPRRWLLTAGLAALGAGAVALLAVFWPRPAAGEKLPDAPRAQNLLKAFKPARGRDDDGAVRNGDRVQVRFEVPAGTEARVFWLDTEGKLSGRATGPAGEGRLRHPPDGKDVPIVGPPGTEVIVAVCSRSGRPLPTREEVRGMLDAANGTPGRWPALGEKDPRLLMHPKGVDETFDPRGGGTPEETPLSKVRTRLEALRALLKKHCDWAWAVAVPHI